ncbi:ATP-dependent RNA helicase A protein-like [Oculina patagonica]
MPDIARVHTFQFAFTCYTSKQNSEKCIDCLLLFHSFVIGVLLRKLENGLHGISHVVVDEIHERDINTDFVLVILRDMIQAYPNLRVVLMSATIDTQMFTEYFGNCPIVEIEGRAFPVQEYYLEDVIQMLNFVPPLPEKKKKRDDVDDDEEENCNLTCSDDYSFQTKNALAQLSEKEMSFELVEVTLFKP